MTDNSETSSLKPSYEKIPFNDLELNKRSLIWTMKLGRFAKIIFNNYLNHCNYDIAQPNETAKQNLFQGTVKEILTILIWLSIIEIKQEFIIGDWLKSLVLEAFAISDVMQPIPGSYDIMNKYNLTHDGFETATQLSINLCNLYELGNSTPDALVFLSNEIMATSPKRKEFLNSIVFDSLDSLEKSL